MSSVQLYLYLPYLPAGRRDDVVQRGVWCVVVLAYLHHPQDRRLSAPAAPPAGADGD